MIKKFRILLIFITLSLSLCIMSNTYSRYIADATGNLEVVFSKWQILLNNQDITNNTSSSIEIIPTIEENANIKENTFAPTSKGYFDIAVDPTNVGVSFNYSVELGIENTDMPDLMITKYAILDKDYIEGNSINYISLTNGAINDSKTFDRTVEDFQFEPFTIRVYFEWYEGSNEAMNDEADTTVGNNAAINDTSFKINANISFEQQM